MSHKAKAAEYKKNEVSRLKKLIESYKVIAIADMTSMPSPQLQRLRSSLKNSVLITMSKGKLIKLAIDSMKEKIKGIELLEPHISGMPALLLTNDNPFKLSKALRKSKSKAPAKSGQIALNDIVVHAGSTSLPPGPIIGELGTAGIKAGIEEGKVAIKADSVVVKSGNIISAAVAAILSRLGMEPMEIGVKITAAYENGVIFGREVLNVDDETYLANLKSAARDAFHLSLAITYVTKENIKTLIGKAYRESNGLSNLKKIIPSKIKEQPEEVKTNKSEAKEVETPQPEEVKKKVYLVEDIQELEIVNIGETESKTPDIETINEIKEIIDEQTPETIDEKKNELKSPEEEFKEQEKTAQAILTKMQEAAMAKTPEIKIANKRPSASVDEAKEIFKKLQEEKIKKLEEEKQKFTLEKVKPRDEDFKSQEKKAQDVLKKLQDDKIEKEGKSKPRGFFDDV